MAAGRGNKLRVLLIGIISACAFAAWGQPMAPGQPPAPSGPSRSELMDRLKTLENAGRTADGEYNDTLKALGYHDLLAENLEKRLKDNEDGCASHPALWRTLGEAWMLTGPCGREKAFEAFKRALGLKPEDGETLALMAQLLHREGLYDQAAAAYEKALTADSGNVRAKLGKAVLLAREGAIAESSRAIDGLGMAAQPYDVSTRIMLRKALDDFERRGGWLDDTPENHSAYARLLYRAGRLPDALIASRRAVELAPADTGTWNFIAAMQVQLGNLEQARQAYDKSLEAGPNQRQIEAARNQIVSELSARGAGKKQ